MKKVVILRPTISQVMELLGEWVVCRVDYPECNEVHYTTPSRIVGIVVPALGSAVHAQLLMSDGSESLPVEGYEYELILEDVRSLQVVEAGVAQGMQEKGMGTRIHARFAAVLASAPEAVGQSVDNDDERLVRLVEARTAEPARAITLDEL